MRELLHSPPLSNALLADISDEANRLSRCHLCGQLIAASAELFMLDDLAFCCASHRAAAAAGGTLTHNWQRMGKGAGSPMQSRLPTTGVGLAASHRSWFSLEDLADASNSSGASSAASSPPDNSRQRRGSAPGRPPRVF
ncbi:hypothetical protein KFE25_011892 [Diacronema lutheri]|uniref:Uncharacterized protein n=2 Tax=Diacronema lutheri TaxID=2081491 RepID=A0A8J6C6U1_DIALT|nr:hypothetical protein KFE25_011892 [Diacronema lutheri]